MLPHGAIAKVIQVAACVRVHTHIHTHTRLHPETHTHTHTRLHPETHTHTRLHPEEQEVLELLSPPISFRKPLRRKPMPGGGVRPRVEPPELQIQVE